MNAQVIDPSSAAPSGKKTWQLVAPDWAALDTVWRNDSPFVLWPIGHQPLLAHWMDEAVRRDIEIVELYVADKPAQVRAWIDDGVYWSRRVRLIPIATEAEAPAEAERIDHLPGQPAPPLPRDPSELPHYWFELQKQWLAQRSPETMTIDRRHPSGGWVGPRTKIHPSVRLKAPFWIGAYAQIGPGCEIGPNAMIAEGSILDRNVHVEEACVLPRTYLGQNTSVSQSAADGNVLLSFRLASRVQILDPFIMASVGHSSVGPGILARLLALVCWLLVAPLLWFGSDRPGGIRRIRWRRGETFYLKTGRRGPLWFRRASWLRHIAAGRMQWIGVLPRGLDESSFVPEEIVRELRKAPPGMFSLADVYGCEELAHPDEWVHAVYQACPSGGDAEATVFRNLWKVAWSRGP